MYNHASRNPCQFSVRLVSQIHLSIHQATGNKANIVSIIENKMVADQWKNQQTYSLQTETEIDRLQTVLQTDQ